MKKISKILRILSAALFFLVFVGLVFLDSPVVERFYLYELLGASLSVLVAVYGLSGMMELT